MAVWTNTSTGGDSDICIYNLPCSHAYTLIGKIQAVVGNATANPTTVALYKIRNPWRLESQSTYTSFFNGSFSDNATIW
jgi:hypothetical protein